MGRGRGDDFVVVSFMYMYYGNIGEFFIEYFE